MTDSGAADGVVFVHGGFHDSRYWRPTMEAIARRAPGLNLLAVDLPGRRGMPGETSLSGCVESVVQKIDRARIRTALLVGHSLAGITLPGIATELGAERVRRIVAVSCCVPPQGKTVADTVSWPIRFLVVRLLQRRQAMPRWVARQIFCNGMTPTQTELSLRLLVPDAPDAPVVTGMPADRAALSPRIPRTWVLTLRDRALPPRVQLRSAANLEVSEIVPIDTGHNVMIADPEGLATILVARL